MIGSIGMLLLQTAGVVTGSVRVGTAHREAVIELTPLDGQSRPSAQIDTVMVDQRELTFLPRTVAITVGGSVLFRNSDPILHNVFSPLGPDGGFDLGTYPRTTSRLHQFDEPGEWIVLCHVHPEMVAYIAVTPSPWHAVTDRDGRFRIEGVPPGRYRVMAWMIRGAKVQREIEITAGRTLDLEFDLTSERRRGG